MRIYVVAGERSGDLHGAGLMRELRQREDGLAITGLGGSGMHELAAGVRDWAEEAGVVGLVEVLRKYPWFRKRFRETLAEIQEREPDAVVLIDYPGFNLRLAKALRQRGYGGRIIYYISPQVWAWHRGRIPGMAKVLDLMLCIFPFEAELYEGCGLRAEFTGHPLVSWHRSRRLGVARDPELIGLFPGSRRREIVKHFPALLEAASLMARSHPGLRFVVSAASPALAAIMEPMRAARPVPGLTIETGTMHELMQRAVCGAVASGTATLEAAIHEMPYCLIYRVNAGTYAVGRALIQVPWLGIVNILAGRQVVKELIQGDCRGPMIAGELGRLQGDAAARGSLTGELRGIVDRLGGGDAYANAAEAVLRAIRGAPRG
jgi:lipid-A-disaccharide synthase